MPTNPDDTDPLQVQAIEATSETASVDFKASLDVDNKGQWLEVLKDLAAMANSGGGVVLFGLDDSGNPTGCDVSPVLNYDTARIGDKLCKYTKVHFGGFTLFPAQRGRIQIAGIRVSASIVPLVFTADGQYLNEHGHERFAFRQGTVYFRHGSKSEPGTSDDLRAFVEREVERVRASWLKGIRQVVEAPPGAVISVGSPIQAANPDRVRLVEDTDAQGVVVMDPNTTHPHRLREVVSEVNQRLADGTQISVHDILGFRRLHQTDSNRSYYYKPKTGSGQYSEAFVQWIVGQIRSQRDFLVQLRQRHHQWILTQNSRRQAAATPVECQYRQIQEAR
jgi:hypothetical protein